MLNVIKKFCADEAGRMIGKPFAAHRALAKTEAPSADTYDPNAKRECQQQAGAAAMMPPQFIETPHTLGPVAVES